MARILWSKELIENFLADNQVNQALDLYEGSYGNLQKKVAVVKIIRDENDTWLEIDIPDWNYGPDSRPVTLMVTPHKDE